MQIVNIHTKDFFKSYANNTIKIVDGDFSIELSINANGEFVDKKMGYWEDAEDTNVIYWSYDDHIFSDKVYIFVISSSDERPCKRQKRYKF